jgi:uncharacterized protein (TIGR00369 family)
MGQTHGDSWHYGLLTTAEHANPQGALHGGILMTFADHGLSMLAWEAAKRAPCTTIQLNTHFLAPVEPGDFVELQGDVTRATQRTCVRSWYIVGRQPRRRGGRRHLARASRRLSLTDGNGPRAMDRGPLTLAIDIGATGLKAGVLDADGKLVVSHARVDTPKKGTPADLVAALLG